MSAPRKLTDAQIQFALDAIAKRREALRTARSYPTLDELAAWLGVTPRYLGKVIGKSARAARA